MLHVAKLLDASGPSITPVAVHTYVMQCMFASSHELTPCNIMGQ